MNDDLVTNIVMRQRKEREDFIARIETLEAERDRLREAYERRLALALEALETAKSEMRDWACDHPSMRKINAAIAQIKGEQE